MLGRVIDFTQGPGEGLCQMYGLVDPCSGEVRYIGKARDARKRFVGHLRDSRRLRTPVYAWIRSLTGEGRLPVLWIMRTCAEAEWPDVERGLIAKAREERMPLLNIAPGGNQPSSSREQNAARAKAMVVSRTSTPEKARFYVLMRNLNGELKRGNCSPALRERMRAAAVARPDLFACWANA